MQDIYGSTTRTKIRLSVLNFQCWQHCETLERQLSGNWKPAQHQQQQQQQASVGGSGSSRGSAGCDEREYKQVKK